MRVEGTLAGFEVKLSDVALASLIKVQGSCVKYPLLLIGLGSANDKVKGLSKANTFHIIELKAHHSVLAKLLMVWCLYVGACLCDQHNIM